MIIPATLSENELTTLMDLVNGEIRKATNLKAKASADHLNNIWNELYRMRENYRESVESLKAAHG